jgi:hypothetical protein
VELCGLLVSTACVLAALGAVGLLAALVGLLGSVAALVGLLSRVTALAGLVSCVAAALLGTSSAQALCHWYPGGGSALGAGEA